MAQCNKCDDKKFTMEMEYLDKAGWTTLKFKPCECTISNSAELEQLHADLQRVAEKNDRLSSEVRHWRSEYQKVLLTLWKINDVLEGFGGVQDRPRDCAR